MPAFYQDRNIARAWSVPPWVVSGEPDTPETRALWRRRELFIRSLE